jgi:GNAT superfamily N-acetyltransferase
MSTGACPVCRDAGFAALADAVAADDLDGAIERGLLAFEAPPACCDACRPQVAAVQAARDARLRALAARERYRTRQARLAERAEAKARRRGAAQPMASHAMTSHPMADPPTVAPALPSAALAALARAKARAATKRSD